jgi:Fe-S-cluster containining protein
MTPSSPPDRRLFVQSEQWFQRVHAALLGALPCRQGCSRCCIGPFAITILDIAELRRGLPTLPEQIRLDIESRARAQIAALESVHPRLKATPFLDDWPDLEVDHLAAQFGELPCPALDTDGSCRVYPFRPLACRTMGIPVETDGLVQGACEVQTSVPLIRPSRAAREEEEQLAEQEAGEIAMHREAFPRIGEEALIAYGFVPDRLPD